jgi:hypothetical protein
MLMNGLSNSIGKGMIVLVVCSLDISRSVCK